MTPSLPSNGEKGSDESLEVRIMPQIAYMIKKTGMGHQEIMDLPFPVFLSLLRENQIMDMEETEEGREYLAKIERLKVTDPDMSALSQMNGFKKKVIDNG